MTEETPGDLKTERWKLSKEKNKGKKRKIEIKINRYSINLLDIIHIIGVPGREERE